jgi:hypothetical protein
VKWVTDPRNKPWKPRVVRIGNNDESQRGPVVAGTAFAAVWCCKTADNETMETIAFLCPFTSTYDRANN